MSLAQSSKSKFDNPGIPRVFSYTNRFRRNAMPDDDFKYLSNTAALLFPGNAQNHTSFKGLNLLVCLLAPSLCLTSRAFTSEAIPTYTRLGHFLLWIIYTKCTEASYHEPMLRSNELRRALLLKFSGLRQTPCHRKNGLPFEAPAKERRRERVTRIELVFQPWEGCVLPLNHTRYYSPAY